MFFAKTVSARGEVVIFLGLQSTAKQVVWWTVPTLQKITASERAYYFAILLCHVAEHLTELGWELHPNEESLRQ